MANTALQQSEPQLTQDHLRQIIDMQSTLGSADFDLEGFLNMTVLRLQEFTRASGAVVELVDGVEMLYRAVSGSLSNYRDFRVPMASSLSGECVRSRSVILCADTSRDPRVNADACKKVNAASMVVVPLQRRDAVIGVLKVISDKPNAFNDHDAYTLQLLTGLLGNALGMQMEMHDQQQQSEALRQQAQYDTLTKLPNRTLFNDRLQHAILRNKRSESLLCIMYMDIDKFKSVNDTHGHAAGDALLQEFAARITSVVRASDTFARLGGDEFILLAEGLHNAKEAHFIANKIVQIMRHPFLMPRLSLDISTSIGIALSSGDQLSAEAFIDQADKALYKAKDAGRNCYYLVEEVA